MPEVAGVPSVLVMPVRETPLPSDPPGAARFYEALGVLLVAWSRLEGQFTLTLLNLMRIAGASAVSHRLPIGFAQRAKLWRQAMRAALPDFPPLHSVSEEMLIALSDIAQDRHTLLHGIWEEFPSGDATRMEIVTIQPKRSTVDGLEFARGTVTISMLGEVVAKINRCNRDLAEISVFVSNLYPAPTGAQSL